MYRPTRALAHARGRMARCVAAGNAWLSQHERHDGAAAQLAVVGVGAQVAAVLLQRPLRHLRKAHQGEHVRCTRQTGRAGGVRTALRGGQRGVAPRHAHMAMLVMMEKPTQDSTSAV